MAAGLFRFLMNGVLFAFGAVFAQFDTIGIVFLVFVTAVISVFTFCAGQGNFNAHDSTS